MDGHALLFTDLVDGAAVVERLGDAKAAGLMAEHRPGGACARSPATAVARSTTATASSSCSRMG